MSHHSSSRTHTEFVWLENGSGSFRCLDNHHAHFSAVAAGLSAVHHHFVLFAHCFASHCTVHAHLFAHHAHLHCHFRFTHHEVCTHLAHLSTVHHHLHHLCIAVTHLHALHDHFCTTTVAFHAGLDTSLHFFRHHHFYFLRNRLLQEASPRYLHSYWKPVLNGSQGEKPLQIIDFKWFISHGGGRRITALNSYQLMGSLA